MLSVAANPSQPNHTFHHSTSSPNITPSKATFRPSPSAKKMNSPGINGTGNHNPISSTGNKAINGNINGTDDAPPSDWPSGKDDVWKALNPRLKEIFLNHPQFELYKPPVEEVDIESKFTPLNPQKEGKMNGSGKKEEGEERVVYGPPKPDHLKTQSPKPSPPNSSCSTSTDKSTKIDKSTDLYPYPVPTDWSKNETNRRPTAKGLQNLGNSCFANSILQALVYTPALVRMLAKEVEEEYHQNHNARNSWRGGSTGTPFCLTCRLDSLAKAIWSTDGGNGAYISPKGIAAEVRKICPSMRNGHQEDAHEFFRYCIDKLQTETLRSQNALRAPHSVRETSWVHKVWGGRLRSRVHCFSCKHNSDTFDTFMDLSLDLDQRTESVAEALRGFNKRDKLSGKNKYKCESCKKLVDAEKYMEVVKPPQILSIHLKRFTPLGKKITARINPDAQITLRGDFADGANGVVYDLYAATLHMGGGPHVGHYTALVKGPPGRGGNEGGWFEADDSSVPRAGTPGRNPGDTQNVYLLHYVRRKENRLDGVINSYATPGKKLQQQSQSPTLKQNGHGHGHGNERRSLSGSYNSIPHIPSPLNRPGTSRDHAEAAARENDRGLDDGRAEREKKRKREEEADVRDRDEIEPVPLSEDVAIRKEKPAKRAKKDERRFGPIPPGDFYNNRPPEPGQSSMRSTVQGSSDAEADGDEEKSSQGKEKGSDDWPGLYVPGKNAVSGGTQRPQPQYRNASGNTYGRSAEEERGPDGSPPRGKDGGLSKSQKRKLAAKTRQTQQRTHSLGSSPFRLGKKNHGGHSGKHR